MSERGKQLVESIRDTLACPACSYSLRGLHGDLITCPECGQQVNVPQFIAARWTQPLFSAPLYNTLAFPLAWVFLVGLGTLVVAAIIYDRDTPSAWFFLGATAMMLVGWLAMFWYAAKRFGSGEGVMLAVLLHLTLPGYILSMMMLVGGVAGVLANFGPAWWIPLRFGILAAAGVLAFLAASGIERFVARRCIRRHLRMIAAQSSSPPAAVR